MDGSAAALGRFEGKVALITGASDRGIGGAVAERLAREGASLGLYSLEVPDRLLKRLERLGAEHVAWAGDVRSGEQVDAAVAECRARFGRLDVVVNSAGEEVAAPFETLAEEQWQHVLDVNLSGAARVTRAALPHLSSPGGAIVNIASVLGLAGCAGFSAYSASKAGLIGMTQSLAWELAPRGIRAVCVAPGMVHTPMVHKYVEHLTLESAGQIAACHPLGVGLPHDVASAVAFLASDEARWITGITLPMGWGEAFPLPVEQFMQADAEQAETPTVDGPDEVRAA